MKRYCDGCRQMLPKASFWKNRTTPDGLQRRCKTCHRDAKKRSRQRRVERNRESRAAERESNRTFTTTNPVPAEVAVAATAADLDRPLPDLDGSPVRALTPWDPVPCDCPTPGEYMQRGGPSDR